MYILPLSPLEMSSGHAVSQFKRLCKLQESKQRKKIVSSLVFTGRSCPRVNLHVFLNLDQRILYDEKLTSFRTTRIEPANLKTFQSKEEFKREVHSLKKEKSLGVGDEPLCCSSS